MSKKILLKRSNQKESNGQPKLPLPSQIDYGELVINYAKDTETLAIKNSDNKIVTFNKINIVQTSGSSTSNVMSQDAVTTELNKKANKATTLDGYGIIDAKIEDGSITIGKKTIKPLTSVPSEYVTDDELSAKGYQTASQVSSAISSLVDSAPETLNTLNELAAALGDDPNFATTITNNIAKKANASDLENYATKTALTSGLAGKANTSHGHSAAFISGLPAQRALISDGSGVISSSAITSTELEYLGGVTSNIQTQLNNKASLNHTHTIANITGLQDALDDKADASDLSNYATTEALTSGLAGKADTSHTHKAAQITGLSQNKLMVSNANGHPSVLSVTSKEASYLYGVTSNIQTQLNNKASLNHTHEIADINGLDSVTLNNMISYYKFIHSAQNLQNGSTLNIPATNFNHIYQWNVPITGLIALPGAWFNNNGEAMQAYYGWDIKIIINNDTTSAKQISFNTTNPSVDANLVGSTDTFTVPTGRLLYVTLRFGKGLMFVEYNLQDLLS